jgi:cell division inhibitor SepF
MASAFRKLKEFFGFIEEEQEDNTASAIKTQPESSPIIRPFRTPAAPSTPNKSFTLSEIKIEEPRIYEDSLNIATHLREKKPVIINLKYLDSASGKRLIDFMCGTAYAINGHMMKIGENIFLFTPEHVLIADQTDKNHFEQGLEQNEQDHFFRKAAI